MRGVELMRLRVQLPRLCLRLRCTAPAVARPRAATMCVLLLLRSLRVHARLHRRRCCCCQRRRAC
jgi:hypothetical protein